MDTLTGLFSDVAAPGGIALVGTLIGNIWAQYRQTQQTKLDRCDEVNRNYIEYQQLCLKNPELGASPFDTGDDVALEGEDYCRKKILFDILTSIFEQAYVVYLEAPPRARRKRWPGWELFIRQFAHRRDYIDWWRENVVDFADARQGRGKSQYDLRFEKFMHKMFVRSGKASAS